MIFANFYLKSKVYSAEINSLINIITVVIAIFVIIRLLHYRFFYRYDLLEGKSVSTKTGLLGLNFKEYDLDHVSVQINQTLLGKIFGFGNIKFEKDERNGTEWLAISDAANVLDYIPVSYTHLTLPTILRV